MSKKHMKRIDPRDPKRTQENHWQNLPRNEQQPVQEIQGKAKSKKRRVEDD